VTHTKKIISDKEPNCFLYLLPTSFSATVKKASKKENIVMNAINKVQQKQKL
jgi:hypothetical protein